MKCSMKHCVCTGTVLLNVTAPEWKSATVQRAGSLSQLSVIECHPHILFSSFCRIFEHGMRSLTQCPISGPVEGNERVVWCREIG